MRDWLKEFKARGGRGVCVWTPDERRELFGDCSHDAEASRQSYNDMLVARFNAGLPMTRADKREARRLIRIAAAVREEA